MFSELLASIGVFLGLTKAVEEPPAVIEGGLSISERIARDFGFLGEPDEDDDVAAFAAPAVLAAGEPVATVAEAPLPVMVSHVEASHGEAVQTFRTEAAAEEHFAGANVVWLNTATGVYHEKGSRWYGATRDGAYACRIDVEVAALGESIPAVRFARVPEIVERDLELAGAAR